MIHPPAAPDLAPAIREGSLRGLALFLSLFPILSSVAQTDSIQIYRNIERYAEKRKVTRWIYDAIFVTPVSDEEPVAKELPQRRVDPNLKHKGKVVRRIDVHVLDPFGYSVLDTAQSPTNLIQRAGNSLHRRTRANVVRGLLLVHPLDTLDPLRISESERVLRASPMVNDATVRVVPIRGTRDSVDVFVLVHDKWNIDVSGEADLSSGSVTLRDLNFLGWGHQLAQRVAFVSNSPEVELEGTHAIYNIKRSYIRSTLSYSTSSEVDRAAFSLDRGFYSALTRWAGGVYLGKTWTRAPYVDPGTGNTIDQLIAPIALDTWLARGFTLGDGQSVASRSTNLVLGVRYAQTRYADRPSPELDTYRVYSNTSLYLTSVGLSMRQYYRERYLYRFGATEDVPEGLLLAVSGGALKRELMTTMPYVGIEFSGGANTEHFGYLSGSLGYGTFFKESKAVDGTLRGELTYFSNIADLGRWHFRQFVRARSTFGFSKPVYSYLTYGGSELYGLSGDTLIGTYKLLLNFETVAYAPYNLLGFRIAPVMFIGFGDLGNESDAVFSGRIHSAFSLGLLVRNENLLTKTFEITVGYYPVLPDGRRNVFQLNPSVSFALGARGFTFDRPNVVSY